ncbi:MAG: hypothetical protein HZB14_03990 [Actinobacteria bacterium]|nr:hypothetical protein [Actinomycetota bacterium]
MNAHDDRARLLAITPREASIFACAADALLAPEPDLPPVRETAAAAGFDQWMAASPVANRLAVRGGLYFLEIAPRLSGRRKRFRRLAPAERRDFLSPPGRRRPAWQAAMIDTLRMLSAAVYYGDDDVARRLGYDADARLERGRALRASEGRP